MKNLIPMTLKGSRKLQKELEKLKKIKRPRIINAIIKAREYGDLKENAEYHAAKEEQSFCERRIRDIEYKLSNANIIDITKVNNNGTVIFGSTIKISNIDTGKIFVYTIVGDDESDCKKNLISIYSPVARGLIGKKIKDIVAINTPNGIVKYVILKIKYIAI
ncbi:transcription elongation factor GreA [Buchnera aphidicola (Mollitrichosiphum nigrofasciatum)]|uniref:transcription elongation factor GreA n=1 Tax=Buchnera aphidicola TaxID=9 RepID=UPI0031B81ECF